VSGSETVTWQDYARAERFLPWNADRLAFALEIEPTWIEESDSFWYRVRRRDGVAFVRVDAAKGTRAPAFNHERLAAALSEASGKPVDPQHLPFDKIELAADGSTVGFTVDGTNWLCDLATYACTKGDGVAPEPTDAVRSPDGQWEAFARDDNLWVRKAGGGGEKQLSQGGVEENAFGSPLVSPLATAGLAEPDKPVAFWSPDGKRVLTVRIDTRDALKFHLVQSLPLDGSIRPKLHSYVYPLPGDTQLPKAEIWSFDVETGEGRKLNAPDAPMLYYGSPLWDHNLWWSEDGDRAYVLTRDRGYLAFRLTELNTATGAAREVVAETSEQGIDPFLFWAEINVRVIGDGSEVIWWSQRDGWAHLYRYNAKTGKPLNRLTSGAWNVAEIVHVDEPNRLIYLTGLGREDGHDPYYQHLYRVSLDGGEPELLTPENAEHSIVFSPSGKYFIDTTSRLDQPPTTLLRSSAGALVLELEQADVSALTSTGWQAPERFTAKARDGVTDVYGVIFRPTGFDPSKQYPVIDNIYAGPQVNQAPTSFADSRPFGGPYRAGRGRGFWHAQAIAELGFVVVMIDGLGMPGRSKAYHDKTYLDLGDGGIEDHIVALRQLGDRYPYLDLSRVGIFGHSAGGYASAHAILTFPDFYKVCVSSAGNHDHRLDKAVWVERYMGFPVGDHYREQANQTLAANLKGKLLLIHGEMDENVHIASTYVLVDALIKENKDFDLLVIPNTPHFCDGNRYFVRRRWDYFVRHLLGAEPPAGYRIAG
jgi:dipeptidyl aminopeptidase/acylaminoacyl peptidase